MSPSKPKSKASPAKRGQAKSSAQATHSKAPAATAPSSAKPASKTVATRPVEDVATAAFLREVDAAMQAEKWHNLWRQWRWPLAGGLVGALALLAGVQGWQAWQAQQHRGMAEAWYLLAQEEDLASLTPRLETYVETADDGYRALGQLALAAAAPEAALRQYQALGADRAQPAWLQAMGQLNAAVTQLETDPATAQATLEELAKTTPNARPLPTTPVALELLALLAMSRDDTATAQAYTERLLALPELGGTLTPAMRARALQRLGLLNAG